MRVCTTPVWAEVGRLLRSIEGAVIAYQCVKEAMLQQMLGAVSTCCA